MNSCKAEELKPSGGQDYILGERKLGRWLLYLSLETRKIPPETGSWQLFAWRGGVAFVRSLRLTALRYRRLGGGRRPMRCSCPRRQVGAALEGELGVVVLIGFFKRAPSRHQ